MIDLINRKYNLALLPRENLAWNECGYSETDGIVTRLGFYDLPLANVPAEVFDTSALQMLSLVNNNLSEIPSDIEKLYNLRELYIGGNALLSLPSQIGGLSSLIYLYIIEDELSSLPSSLSGLNNLKELVISTNNPTAIIDDIHAHGISSKKIVVNNVEIV
ncbi:MAG: leucine-rich repeat domain-containing protein [Clostridia bacterium]|jgi:Leucine-rich repeat (LRR) protein|nr:leucine-rich repeat domain-containing protein [Clostridia bacterium]MBT7122924.1 leucine-rich repeat domain-containing protein [Clostridia bacterium]